MPACSVRAWRASERERRPQQARHWRKVAFKPFDEGGVELAAALDRGGLVAVRRCTCPQSSWLRPTICSCTCWQCAPAFKYQLRTVRSSSPKAAAIACSGQPCANSVTTVLDPAERCPLTGAEGSATAGACTALFFLAVAHDIAGAHCAPRRAAAGGAEWFVGVHWCSLLVSWLQQVCERPPFFHQSTLFCSATEQCIVWNNCNRTERHGPRDGPGRAARISGDQVCLVRAVSAGRIETPAC